MFRKPRFSQSRLAEMQNENTEMKNAVTAESLDQIFRFAHTYNG
jgi:hypothetical protein